MLVAALLTVYQLFNDVVEIEDNGFIGLYYVFYLLLFLLFLLLELLDLSLLPLDDTSVEFDVHTAVSILYLHISIANLLQ